VSPRRRIVTFLVRSRTSDAAYAFFFTACTTSLGLGQLCGPAIPGTLADLFGLSAIGWFGRSKALLFGCLASIRDPASLTVSPRILITRFESPLAGRVGL